MKILQFYHVKVANNNHSNQTNYQDCIKEYAKEKKEINLGCRVNDLFPPEITRS